MKIQYVSDLHLEFKNSTTIEQHDDADLVILAGDIHKGLNGVDWVLNTFKKETPVIYVFGNHEYYSNDYLKIQDKFNNGLYFENNLHVGTNVVYVNDELKIRVLGVTLWTDFGGNAEPAYHLLNMDSIRRQMNDYKYIKYCYKKITPYQIYHLHENELKWLKQQLQIKTYKNYKTIVVTHHAPHKNSIHKKYQTENNKVLNYAYYTDLTELFYTHKIDAWIHGHVHNTFEYKVNNVPILANPRGYTTGLDVVENSKFNPQKILEI